MGTIIDDADEIGWRVAYHNYLCEPNGREFRKMEFEEWKEKMLATIMHKPAPGRVVSVPTIADMEAILVSIPEKPSMATQESAERMHPDLYVQGPCGAMPVWRK